MLNRHDRLDTVIAAGVLNRHDRLDTVIAAGICRNVRGHDCVSMLAFTTGFPHCNAVAAAEADVLLYCMTTD